MKTGAKIAIGCGVAALLAVIALAVALFGMAWWAKGKVEEATGGPGGLERMAEAGRDIERYTQEANRNDFAEPEDGIIGEERLLKFLAVRRDVYVVYEQYEDLIEAQARRETPDLGALGKGVKLITDLRLAQSRAQAREGMSDDEYRWLVVQVYRTAGAESLAGGSDRTASRTAREAFDGAAEAMRRQLEEADQLPPAQKRQLEEAMRQLEAQAGQAESAARQLDVPAANRELFRKHAGEIEKYGMSGLEWLGM